MSPAAGGVHPLSAFLPRIAPELDALNAEAARLGIRTGGGHPLRFVPPAADGFGYEARAYATGAVATRAGNAHDYYNALIWLAFPRAKAALNRRHAAELARHGDDRRGPVRDALTQFDECGVVVAGMPADMQSALRAHRWREVFVDRRVELLATTRFLVFGHASHDALQAPFVGLCGKAIFLDGEDMDGTLAARLDAEPLTPRAFQPLPLLGIPGATADNEDPAYYDDTRQFRPARRAA